MSINTFSEPGADHRSALRANCADCFALCCTAFGFQKSADFPIDKPAGTPCVNLADDFSCAVHESLPARGFRGCTVFDCFGAGQYVSQNLFSGKSWRERPDTSADMFSTFVVARQLHEMLWYLDEASERTTSSELAAPVAGLRTEILEILDGDASEILASDTESLRSRVRRALIDVSEEARGGYDRSADSDADVHPSADLAGRDARLEGADLSKALFLTQAQVNAAHGDLHTTLPPALHRPGHWLNATLPLTLCANGGTRPSADRHRRN